MIAWPILSCNACNTSHLMDMVRTKRVYLQISSIGECTYMIVPMKVLEKQHWVLKTDYTVSGQYVTPWFLIGSMSTNVLTTLTNFLNTIIPFFWKTSVMTMATLSWIHIEKWCWMNIHMYQFPKLLNLVSLIPNWHHSWIHIEKWVLDIYNTSYIEHM